MSPTQRATLRAVSQRACPSDELQQYRDLGSAVMPDPQIASYASWASPITSDLIVASSIGLGDILTDGRDIYWIESRPQERGRSVIVRCSQDGGPADVTPPMPSDSQGAFNV